MIKPFYLSTGKGELKDRFTNADYSNIAFRGRRTHCAAFLDFRGRENASGNVIKTKVGCQRALTRRGSHQRPSLCENFTISDEWYVNGVERVRTSFNNVNFG